MGGPRAIVPEILNGENYTSWEVCMRSYFVGRGLWDIVDGFEPEPNSETSTTESIKSWKKRNGKALHAIQITCSPKMLSFIAMETYAKVAWDNLASINQWLAPKGLSPRQKLLQQVDGGNAHECNDVWHFSLYKAVIDDDWKETERLLKQYPEAVTARISLNGGTVLHIAVLHGQVKMVNHLVDLMSETDLELKTEGRYGLTALHIAASASVNMVSIAKAMVNKNKNILSIQSADGYTPICCAAIYGTESMLRYLYSVSPEKELDPKTSNNGATLLSAAITADNYGFALELLERFPQLVMTQDIRGDISFNVLALKRSSFQSGCSLSMWQKWVYKYCNAGVDNNYYEDEATIFSDDLEYVEDPHRHSDVPGYRKPLSQAGIEEMCSLKRKHYQAMAVLKDACGHLRILNCSKHLRSLVLHAMFEATESGFVEFISEILRSDPALLWYGTELGDICHAAVANRQENIWNVIYLMGAHTGSLASIEDSFHNNLLHTAGKLAPSYRLSHIASPAMQMRWEVQWFKEVEKLVSPTLREQKNKEGKTPQDVFMEEHKILVKEGKLWMKDTATSCMLVATLIATVMFGAAYALPGADNQEFKPFQQMRAFDIFMISDALSLFSALVSVLMFLSILTSRFSPDDFLDSLPRRLVVGLTMLFFSIATMMVAFGSTLFIIYPSTVVKLFTLCFLSSIPVTLFVALQFPLFCEMVTSTYGHDILKPKILTTRDAK